EVQISCDDVVRACEIEPVLSGAHPVGIEAVRGTARCWRPGRRYARQLRSIAPANPETRLNAKPIRPVFAQVKLFHRSTSTESTLGATAVIVTAPKLSPAVGEPPEPLLQSAGRAKK